MKKEKKERREKKQGEKISLLKYKQIKIINAKEIE
jgi:hypothetical protein